MNDLFKVGLLFLLALIVNIGISANIIKKNVSVSGDTGLNNPTSTGLIPNTYNYITFLQNLNFNFTMLILIITSIILLNYHIITNYHTYNYYNLLAVDLLFLINLTFLFCMIFKIEIKCGHTLYKLFYCFNDSNVICT
jgi:hypothetical protein